MALFHLQGGGVMSQTVMMQAETKTTASTAATNGVDLEAGGAGEREPLLATVRQRSSRAIADVRGSEIGQKVEGALDAAVKVLKPYVGQVAAKLPKNVHFWWVEHQGKLRALATVAIPAIIIIVLMTAITGGPSKGLLKSAHMTREDHGGASHNQDTAYRFMPEKEGEVQYKHGNAWEHTQGWTNDYDTSMHMRKPKLRRAGAGGARRPQLKPAAPVASALGRPGKIMPHHSARTDELLSHISMRPTKDGMVPGAAQGMAGTTARGRRAARRGANPGNIGPSMGVHGLQSMSGRRRRGQVLGGPHDAQFLPGGMRPGAHVGEGKIVTSAFHFHPKLGHEVARTHDGGPNHKIHTEAEKHVYHALHLAAGKNTLMRRDGSTGAFAASVKPMMSWENPRPESKRHANLLRKGIDPYHAAYLPSNTDDPATLIGGSRRARQRASATGALPVGNVKASKGNLGGYRGGGYGSYGLKRKEEPVGPVMVPYTVGNVDHSWERLDAKKTKG